MNDFVQWLAARPRPRQRLAEAGFQTAEAIGIAAVGLIVLVAVLGVLESLGVDVVLWIRSQFGVPSG